jgi:hypothetical protein
MALKCASAARDGHSTDEAGGAIQKDAEANVSAYQP